MSDTIRQEIIDTCRAMNGLSINQGTSGNVSARQGDQVLITPSGMPYDSLTPADIVALDMDGTAHGPRLPSSEWHFHLDLMRDRPDLGAVVHTHSPYATAFSCLRRDMPAFHYMIAACGGNSLRCAEYATFGTPELSENMTRAMDGRTACLLANHGVIAAGPDLAHALGLAVEVEALARQYAIACQMGDPVILDDAEMDRVIEKFKTYGVQPDS